MAFVTPASVFDEVFDFLASSPSAEALVAYEPPFALQERFSDLADLNRLVSRIKLRAQADDPEIQRDLRLIAAEFMPTEEDGLDGL